MGELAAQVLGYVGTDNHGLAGLELIYDREVTGKPGKRTVLRDARHGTVAAPDLSSAEPEPGHDLYLTLDATVQHIVERELARAIEERHAKRGSAIFLDPATGGVLAMASYPPFDPNDFASYPPESWRNRAIIDVYEPGSTFKIVTAAAALGRRRGARGRAVRLRDGRRSPSTDIRIRDHKPYGRLTFADVIAKSSNVGVIKARPAAGRRALLPDHPRPSASAARRGSTCRARAAASSIRSSAGGLLDKAYIAFGQGISVTPLQLAAATAAVANGGTLLRPHVVAAVSRGERASGRRG